MIGRGQAAAVALLLTLVPVAVSAAQSEPPPTEVGAWTRWSYLDLGAVTPRFFSLIASRLEVPPPPVDGLPFRYSVAVLVGIQDYDNFDDFQFVSSDINTLREFLLGNGGFDTVYVLRPGSETPDAVEKLIKNELRTTLESRDRLLFYFSGHGASANGNTGYLVFPKARKDDFVTDLLAVSDLREWSRILPVRHALFVLDSCSAGSGVREKVGDLQTTQMIIEALKRHGSRIILTAGTENERSIEITDGKGSGGSLFTSLFLQAMQGQFTASGPFDMVLTTEEVFAEAQKRTVIQASALDKTLTPDIEHLQNPPFTGTFLFLNPHSTGKDLHPVLADGLGFPGAARIPDATAAQPVKLVVGLKSQHRSGSSLIMDFGKVGAGGPIARKLTVEAIAKEPLPLRLSVEGEGVDASFTGGLWSTVASPGRLVEIDVTLWPERLGSTGPAIELHTEDRLLTKIRIQATPTKLEIVRETSSGPKDSGPFKSFSGSYELCLGAPEKGYTLVSGSDEFWLTGDRLCGSWSTCEVVRRDATNVCWAFSLQGHDEILENRGIRQSEGHLRARYELRESETFLLTAN